MRECFGSCNSNRVYDIKNALGWKDARNTDIFRKRAMVLVRINEGDFLVVDGLDMLPPSS